MSLLAAVGIQPSKGFSAAEAEASALDWRILRRILTHTRPYAAKRNTIFALTVARAIQKPAMAWAIAAVINGPITGGDYSGAVWGAAGFFALALVTELTFHFRQRLQLELGEAVVHDLRNDVFRQLQRMPLSYFNKTKLGRILGRVITDIESVRRGVQNVFFFSLMLFGQMAGAAALMLYYNWALFCVLLAVGPLVWLTNRHFHPRLSRHSRAAAESQSRLTGSVAETVKGMRVIQGYARQRESDDRYGRLIDRHSDNNVGLANESSLYLPLLDLHSQVFLAALLVVGGYGALHGFAGMEIGSLIAFSFCRRCFFSPSNTSAIFTRRPSRRWPEPNGCSSSSISNPIGPTLPGPSICPTLALPAAPREPRPARPSSIAPVLGSNSATSRLSMNPDAGCSTTSPSRGRPAKPSPSSATPAAARRPSST